MARPRSKGALKNSDGRYMIHVYLRGVKKPVRVYLREKNRSVYDRKTADQIYSYLECAIDRGDVETVRKRIRHFKRVGVDSVQSLMWALEDRPENVDEWLAEHDPDLLRELDHDVDYGRLGQGTQSSCVH